MLRRQLRRRVRWTAIALVVSVISLAFASAYFAQQLTRTRDAISQQANVTGWVRLAQSVEIELLSAETGQRGYVLTGKQSYLDPYHRAVADLPAILDGLDGMPIVDPSLPGYIADLREMTRLKLAELAETIRLYDTQGRDASVALVRTDAGQQYMDNLRVDLDAIARISRDYRQTMTGRIQAGTLAAQRWAVLTIIGLVASLVLAAIQIRLLLSSHRRFEDALATSERFTVNVTDAAPARLVYMDQDRRLRFVNRATCRRYGKTAEELLGLQVTELGNAALRDAHATQAIDAAYQGRAQRFEYEETVEGHVQQVECHLKPDLGPDHKVRGVFVLSLDITELKSVERKLRELTDVFEATSDFIAQADDQGRILYLNPAARRQAGLNATEPVDHRSFNDYYTPETVARFQSEILPAVWRWGVWLGETWLKGRDGRDVPVNHMVIGHPDLSGRCTRYSSVMRDISQEVSARRQLALQTATLKSVVEAMPSMVAVFDTEMRYVMVNGAFERWRNLSRDQLIGRTVRELMAPAEYEQSLPYAQQALSGKVIAYEKTYPNATAVRHVALTYFPSHFEDGTVSGFIAVAHDITEHREENRRLADLSEHDPLTGLFNRAGFERLLKSILKQGPESTAVLYIDLDRFKPVNDRHGHAAGDEVLRLFAQRLQRMVRRSDVVARLGGDEFAVVLAGIRDPDPAVRMADQVVAAAGLPFTVAENLNVEIGASVGIALSADAQAGDVGDWQTLLARADGMVYEAKAQGRGKAVLGWARLKDAKRL